MAARAGASRVISVEWSNIVEFTKRIVRENNYENVITIIKGKIDRIKLPHGIQKVDVIISFWMGYSLLCGCKYIYYDIARMGDSARMLISSQFRFWFSLLSGQNQRTFSLSSYYHFEI